MNSPGVGPTTYPCESDPIASERTAINPYLSALGLIWGRACWDLNPNSWAARSRMKAWKNRYLDQKAVILCNGPSLLHADLSMLDTVFTFGLNKINLLFQRTAFRPSCIVSVNPHVIIQNMDYFRTTELPLFLDRYALTKGIRGRDNVVFMHSANIPKFARDCSFSVYQGFTVTYVALELAFHMGFSEVALVGCDHHFNTSGPANKRIRAEGKDENHFDPGYFSGGNEWQLPNLWGSEFAYQMAKEVYESYGRKIMNATAGGRLDVFERVALQKFLSE